MANSEESGASVDVALAQSVARLDEATAKFEEIEPYLENFSFWPSSPVGRRLVGFLAFNGLGGMLLAAYKLGDLDSSLVFFALAAHAVGIGFFFASLLAARKVWRMLKELEAATGSRSKTDGDREHARARFARVSADIDAAWARTRDDPSL